MTTKLVSVDAAKLEGFKIETKTRQHIAYVDQPTAGGGTDTGPTPLEYLFISLAGCIISIGEIIARQRQLPLRGISCHVEGELDTDVLMGKTKEVRAGFSAVRVVTRIDADMTPEEKEKFLHEIDSRCPISDNILNSTPVEIVLDKTTEIFGSKN